MSTPLEFIQSHRAQFERELCDLLRIPSVSTLPARRDDVRAAADWIATHLRDIGLTVDVIPTARHPLVYAEWLQAPGRPTVLGYGHSPPTRRG
jgi:acetylornithine deacetylase/succinyl-diaminopimelate desuccinylase-like protein